MCLGAFSSLLTTSSTKLRNQVSFEWFIFSSFSQPHVLSLPIALWLKECICMLCYIMFVVSFSETHEIIIKLYVLDQPKNSQPPVGLSPSTRCSPLPCVDHSFIASVLKSVSCSLSASQDYLQSQIPSAFTPCRKFSEFPWLILSYGAPYNHFKVQNI